MADRDLTLRITLIAPPEGVMFSLQEGDATPVQQVWSTGADLTFDIPARIGDSPNGPRWLGPYVRREGPRRFAYYCSGRNAGQPHTEWSRRGKIWLTDIPAELVAKALAGGARLEAAFPGSDKRGGPSCASVKPIDGWKVA